MHKKEGQKESQVSAPSVKLGPKSALNFPVTYLQKAGVFVQKTVTTTGVYIHKLINILYNFISSTLFNIFRWSLKWTTLMLLFFLLWWMKCNIMFSTITKYWKKNTILPIYLPSCSDIVIPGANNLSETKTKISAGESIHIIRGTKGNNSSLHPLSAIRE